MMKELFNLPFEISEHPYDWLLVVFIMANIITLLAIAVSYIQFKINPPLEKFQCHNVIAYIKEFTLIRIHFLEVVYFVDLSFVCIYVLYVMAKFIHQIIF